MKTIKAQMALLGIRQNQMARALQMDATRLNRILNDWLKPSSKEEQKIQRFVNTYRLQNDGNGQVCEER